MERGTIQNDPKRSILYSLILEDIDDDECDVRTLAFRNDFGLKREMASFVMDYFNNVMFGGELEIRLGWLPKINGVAGSVIGGYCETLAGRSFASIILNEELLDSAERLINILAHEYCHAAAAHYDGVDGHGEVFFKWTKKMNEKFPELNSIQQHHQYEVNDEGMASIEKLFYNK